MLIIVRHSERLDEVDEEQWYGLAKQMISHPNNKRNKKSICADPPITSDGMNIAHRAGDSLIRILPTIHPAYANGNNPKIRLYSSRLLRCLQTTICIAKKLGINEIYVSRGLSLTAAAVEKLGSSFDFLSMEEIVQLTENQFIIHDCDQESFPFAVSPTDWFLALNDVVRHSVMDEVKVVVAHRETIRNLLPEFPRLPYCAIAACHHIPHEHDPMNTIHPRKAFHIPEIFDSHGNRLFQYERF